MEAEQSYLSYSELLQMIVNDELQVRRNRTLERLITNEKLETSKTIELFDLTFNPSINAAQIRELSLCRFIEKAENIFLISPTGTGKSHLAKAIGHCACRKNMTVQFFNFYDLFSQLSKAALNNKLDTMLKSLVKTDLLIIDDFAF